MEMGVKDKYLLEQLSLLEVLYRPQETDSHRVLRDHRRLFCMCDISIRVTQNNSVSFPTKQRQSVPLLSEKRAPIRTLRCF